MEAPSGERDDGGDRRHRGRAERALGPSERELCQWLCAGECQNGPRVERIDQGSRRRFRDRRWAKHHARRSQKRDRKSTRLNSSHLGISYAVFCLKKKKK